MNIRLVGGQFDKNGGRFSGTFHKFYTALRTLEPNITQYVNGGHADDLKHFIPSYAGEVIIWFADVDNSYFKEIVQLKQHFPKAFLVTSKRNMREQYSFQELVAHALKLKSNLVVEFGDQGKMYKARVFDPLGVVWQDFTTDLLEVATAVVNRIDQLLKIKRVPSIQIGLATQIPNDPHFFNAVRHCAERFNTLINPAKVAQERFLGNASFRCTNGFPSFERDGNVFVSKRNVDKSGIDRDGFVQVVREKVYGSVLYYGNHKPSVDTPIQLRLRELFPMFTYMIHGHVYVDGAPFTKKAIPCGGMQEVDEIVNVMKTLPYAGVGVSVNLIGHGCLVFSRTAKYFESVPFIKREVPEVITND